MGDFYQFSHSSLPLLEKCLTAANQPDIKWIELFKPDTREVSVTQNNNSFHDNDDTSLVHSDVDDAVMQDSELQPGKSELEKIEKIGASLDSTPNKLEYLSEQCNYEHLLPTVAENLTSECIDTICEDLLKTNDIRCEKFLLYFFPVYIKRNPPCDILNLLLRGYKTYPDTIISLIESLFMNTDIPNKILDEFFIAINDTARLQFLKALSLKELPTEVVMLRLNTISGLYKSSKETSEIHSFVLNGLLQTAQLCENDKNYGRCLLTFYQGLNETDAQKSRLSLEQLLDSHKTPFKRPCQAILNNFYNI